MRAGTTVGIDNDFTAGQTAVTLWATDNETAGRIDQIFRLFQPFGRHHRLDDFLDNRFFNLLVFNFRRMLGRQDDRFSRNRFSIDIPQCNL